MTEKLDGVRAYYDPTLGLLISRIGTVYPAPPFFFEGFPKHTALDGELYIQRQKLAETLEIVKDGEHEGWNRIRYKVFDAPAVPDIYEQRLVVLSQVLSQATFADIVHGEICRGKEHVYESLKAIEALGGEGIMLRKPKSLYIGKRSATLLKVKSFYDAEARVQLVVAGKGKFTGMMGALQCTMASGAIIKIGTGFSDKDRLNPPQVGSVVTYRFIQILT